MILIKKEKEQVDFLGCCLSQILNYVGMMHKFEQKANIGTIDKMKSIGIGINKNYKREGPETRKI
jgi:hypothetical protein